MSISELPNTFIAHERENQHAHFDFYLFLTLTISHFNKTYDTLK